MSRKVVAPWILAAGLAALPADTLGQGADPIAAAQQFYFNAAYEDALAVLEDTTTPQGRIYRALCLMALARLPEAESTLEALVRSNPEYVPRETELPPRFLTLFDETRRAVLPELVRDGFMSAQTAFQNENWTEAVEGFRRVLGLLEDPQVAPGAISAHYVLLATSYIELADKALADEAAEAERRRLAALRTADVPPPPPPREFIRPVAVHQTFPAWPGTAGTPDGLLGRIRLVVDVEGRVSSAVMDAPMHPQYDIRLVAAAMTWRYEPATLDGVPVEVEHVVEVRLGR